MPQYQRQGFGRFLIEFSMSKLYAQLLANIMSNSYFQAIYYQKLKGNQGHQKNLFPTWVKYHIMHIGKLLY